MLRAADKGPWAPWTWTGRAARAAMSGVTLGSVLQAARLARASTPAITQRAARPRCGKLMQRTPGPDGPLSALGKKRARPGQRPAIARAASVTSGGPA